MIAHLLVATALALDGGEWKAAFPQATTTESPAGGRFTSASGFEAPGLGKTPEAAARAFLRRYGAAFGVVRGQELVAQTAPRPGRHGAVRFERRIGGLPLFDGDVVVGVDSANSVVLVNAADVPPRVTGRPRLSRAAAIRAAADAMPGVEMARGARARRGWRAAGTSIRPVWRVDLAAVRPPGEWRTYVDAETGKVLLRVDLRV